MRCAATGEVKVFLGACSPQAVCDCCGLPGRLRPDVVWFGDLPMGMPEIERALMNCDLFISIGTSGNVYPAAGFVRLAAQAGAHTVELNLEPSQTISAFDEAHHGKATEIVPRFLESLELT